MASMWLVPTQGPYSGQMVEYAAHVGQHALDFGFCRKPTVEELHMHQHGVPLETAVKPPAETPEVPTTGFPRHTGGGMYVLSDESKVRGKKKAEKAQRRIG